MMDTLEPKPDRRVEIRDIPHLRALHRQYLTASRLGALYGDGYTSRWQEHMILSGRLEPAEIEGKLLDRGNELQPIVAAKLQKLHPDWRVENVNAFFAHPTIPRLGASPDQIITAPGRSSPGAGEAKIVNGQMFREAWSDGPPLFIELQHHCQMMCMGTDWGVISALVIGTWDWEFKAYVRDLRPGTVKKIERDVRAFLADVDAGKEPKVDPIADAEAISDLYAEATDPPIDLTLDNRMPELVRELEMSREGKSSHTKREAAAKAEILAKIGAASGAKVAGGIFIDAPTVRRTGYTVQPTAFRVIKITDSTTAKPATAAKPSNALLKAAMEFQRPL